MEMAQLDETVADRLTTDVIVVLTLVVVQVQYTESTTLLPEMSTTHRMMITETVVKAVVVSDSVLHQVAGTILMLQHTIYALNGLTSIPQSSPVISKC